MITAASRQNQQNGIYAQRKTQISLGICPVWSESLLCAQWVAKAPSFFHVGSEDSDQTGHMPRLIWVFAGRTCHFVIFVMRRLIRWPNPSSVYLPHLKCSEVALGFPCNLGTKHWPGGTACVVAIHTSENWKNIKYEGWSESFAHEGWAEDWSRNGYQTSNTLKIRKIQTPKKLAMSCKILKIRTLEKFTVITQKFEQEGSKIE